MCKKFKQELFRRSIYLDRFYIPMIDHEPCVFRGVILVEDLMACSFPCLISLIVMKTLFPPELFRRVGEKRELLLKCLRRRPSPSRKSRQSLPARRQGRRQRLSGPLRRVVGLRRETVRGGAGARPRPRRAGRSRVLLGGLVCDGHSAPSEIGPSTVLLGFFVLFCFVFWTIF